MSDMEGSSSSDKAPIAPKPDSKTVPVQELLECTICLEVAPSPIHACSNGHIICGLCSDNVKKCGLCNSGPLSVSSFAERLAHQFDFKTKCPNYEAGCRNLVSSTELKEHIPKCYYRNVICNEWEGEVCYDVSIPFKDFPGHLMQKHDCRTKAVNKWYFAGYNKDGSRDETSWSLEFTTKDNKFFLMHSYMDKDAIYFWVTVLGDKEEADKHMYELTLEKELNEGKKMKSCWTMPVLAYHDYPEFDGPSPRFITISEAVFIDFCDQEEVEDGKQYHFNFSYRIL